MKDTWVRTNCVVYAGWQKQQERNLHRLPAGVVGRVLHHQEVTSWNMEYFLVCFYFAGKKCYAKLAASTFDPV